MFAVPHSRKGVEKSPKEREREREWERERVYIYTHTHTRRLVLKSLSLCNKVLSLSLSPSLSVYQGEWTRKIEIGKLEFLVASKACQAVF